MRPLRRLLRSLDQQSLWQVAASYLLGVWAALQLTDTVSSVLGLPESFLRLVLVLLLSGLPLVLLLAWLQARRADSSHHLARAWRPAVLAAGAGISLLAVTTTAWVGTRAIGLGPARSLVDRGTLHARALLVLADVQASAGDSALAQAATEALRIDLEQSRTLSLMERAAVRAALARMLRPDARLDEATALELAQREGAQAVVVGAIGRLRDSYLVSLRLLAAEDGRVLLSLRDETNSDRLVKTLGRLTRRLRERAGEPLRGLGTTRPLERLTTRSVDALRLYAQAGRALNVDGDAEQAVALGEQAIARDSLFALAYVQLGIALLSLPDQAPRTRQALTRAYELRDRLSGPERHLVEATYYDDVAHDAAAARAAYLALRENYPGWKATMVANNLALLYEQERDYARAAAFYREALQHDSSSFVPFLNLAVAQFALGSGDSAGATLRAMAERHGANPWTRVARTYLASAEGRFLDAEAELNAIRDAHATDPFWQEQTTAGLANLARLRGQLGRAEELLTSLGELRARAGDTAGALNAALDRASISAGERADGARALRQLAAALASFPLDRLAPEARPYLQLARLRAAAGDAAGARAEVQAFERSASVEQRRSAEQELRITLAWIALAGGDAPTARRAASTAEGGACRICPLPLLARAYQLGGAPDSAIAVYQRYLFTPSFFRLDEGDARWLAPVHLELAALYRQTGQRERERLHLARFIELWKDADPELRPRLQAARQALARTANR